MYEGLLLGLVFVAGLFLGGLIGAAVLTCMVEDELEALDAENERLHEEMDEMERKGYPRHV